LTRKSPEFFKRFIDVLNEKVSYAATARTLNISQQIIFVWMRQSAEAMRRNDNPSPWRLTIDDEEQFFHTWCRQAFSNATDQVISNLVVRCRDGITTETRFQGRRVYRVDPALEALGFEGVDAYARDKDGNYIPETQTLPPRADEVAFLLTSTTKEFARKPTENNVTIKGGGVVTPNVLAARQATQPQQIAPPVPDVILPVLDVIVAEEPEETRGEPEPDEAVFAEINGDEITADEPAPEIQEVDQAPVVVTNKPMSPMRMALEAELAKTLARKSDAAKTA
jgi:hypothetical protein